MDDYKRLIKDMVEKMDSSDAVFLSQLYIIIKKHVAKKGRH